MRTRPAVLAVLVALAALLVATPAQAAFNRPLAFTWDQPMMDGLREGAPLSVISGDVDVRLGAVTGNFGFFGADRAAVAGLTKACWGALPAQCTQGSSVSLVVADGTDFGLGLPGAVDAGGFTADHALGLFVDFDGDEDLNSLDIRRSLMAPAVGGKMAFGSLPPIVPAAIMTDANSGAAVGLSPQSRIEVRNGFSTVHTVTGKSEVVLFAGNPQVEPFAADMVVLPYEAGSTSHWTPAGRGAADEGLELSRIQELLAGLEASNAGNSGETTNAEEPELGPLGPVLDRVLNGAILRTASGQDPAGASTAQQFAFIRFTHADVQGSADDRLAWSGKARLDLQDGHVKGAQPLYGFGYVVMPWWSWALWLVGIGLLVAVLVTKPPKEVPRWQGKGWIGRVAAAVALVVVFVLWDLETRAMWGVSLLSGGMDAFLIVAVLQLAPLGLVMFATAGPIRLILRNALRLGKQGRFMRLSGAIASVLGLVLGAWLLRSYLNLLATQVINQVG